MHSRIQDRRFCYRDYARDNPVGGHGSRDQTLTFPLDPWSQEGACGEDGQALNTPIIILLGKVTI